MFAPLFDASRDDLRSAWHRYAECIARAIEASSLAVFDESSHQDVGLSFAGEASDERLLLELLAGWQEYTRWLSGISGCFSHTHETSCCHHLVCIISAQVCSPFC